MSAGEKHSIFHTEQGLVYVTGCNSEGQLGLGKGIDGCSKPRVLHTLNNIKAISCFSQSLAVSTDGDLFFWGKSFSGHVVWIPSKITSIPNKVSAEIHLSRSMGACLDELGVVWAFG